MTNEEIVAHLETNWEGIRNECLATTQPYIPWRGVGIYNGQWDVYGLFDFPDHKDCVSRGNLIQDHATECPFTVSTLEQIPRLRTAGFSMLMPGCIITPHVGFTDKVLRFHLGLIIPEGDCALKVEDTVYRWQEGKAFYFDDILMHEAWNLTNGPRYVLIVDVYK